MTSTSKILAKSLKSPDETLMFEKEKIEIVNLGNATIARVTVSQDGDEINMGFKWEWNGRSSKHIPFDWSGP